MKFETTPAFDSDYRRLKREHADTFKKIVRENRRGVAVSLAPDRRS
ncbi:MAG: hypothetical protein IPI32_13600 [Austwickia sp.]|nr:hypothetical protein [Austwickia sp.]MBK9101185.1 hypothetical protein [Austwickia sp.]